MPSKCPVCGEAIAPERLHDHLVDAHVGDAPVQELQAEVAGGHRCVLCGASFVTPEGLKEHNSARHAV